MKRLATIEQWASLINESHARPVVAFKHSNACGTSARMFTALVGAEQGWGTEVRVVVVQQAREVADRMAADLGIPHESPQAFVIRNGRAVYDADHGAIDAEEITRCLNGECG